jgi:serine/threonine protein kinase
MAQMDLFRSIVKGEYYTPPEFSMGVSHIVSGFLTKNPGKRLGSLVNKEDDIYNHQWFSNLDFSKLRKKQINPPYKPKIKDPLDSSNFEDWSHLDNKTDTKYPPLTPEEAADFEGF